MGEGDSGIESTKAGFLADVVFFIYASASIGVLAGLCFSVAYWVFKILT